MSAPVDLAALANDVAVEAVTEFVMPNVDATPDTNPTEQPKAKRQRAKITDKLGNNKAARGGPRKLTDNDRDALLGMYAGIGMALMPFKPEVAGAVVTSAEQCVDAWWKLAEKNDGVRRALLAMMEGSAWTGVLVAHVPIIMALLPSDFMARSPLGKMLNGVDTDNDD